MKKLLCLLLCLMMILPAIPSLADDDSGTCGTNLTWTLSGGTLTISGSGAMEDYNSLPNRPYTTTPWAGKQIEKVVIRNGVTSIGTNAFHYCESLSKLTISSSVTSIGEYAFYYCPSLTELTIPSSVKSLGKFAFAEDTGLTSVTIQDGLPSIPLSAFADCDSLSEVHIPVSVTNIGSSAFNNCYKLEDIWYYGSKEKWDGITRGISWDIHAGMFVAGGYKVHCLCTVQFDANGHGKAPKAAYVFPGKTISAPSKPTASGYAFTGWYKEPECTNKWDFGKDPVPGDMTLYAGWKAQSDSGTGENVTNVTLKKVKISGTRSVANNKVEISWKKLSKDQRKAAKKIEIQVCANKHFSKNVITKKVSSKKTSAVISGLKRGKKYYVRIRAYTKKGGVRNVSKWSETKSFTIIKKFD